MSLANKISLFRILLVPCFVASLVYYDPRRDGLRYASVGLFLIGIVSDAVDGFIARAKHQQSQLGVLLDPLADKLLILSALISLSTIQALPDWMRIPAWFNLIVISRDAMLVAGTILVFGLTGKFAVKPSRLGKWAIVAQMLVVLAALLRLPMKAELLVFTASLTVLSGIGYIRMGMRQFG
jgi:CDP-diacylglycerol--glycerol-3-phosphate 3-phosphatidyltransferase/cardiolipin synthase